MAQARLDAGSARERTALSWTRSALNIAATGVLIARFGFTAHFDAVGVASAGAMAVIALVTWRHGRSLYRDRGIAPTRAVPQARALVLLTATTCLIAIAALIVTVAL